MTCEHALTEFCECIQRQPAVNLDGSLANRVEGAVPVDRREAWLLKSEPWSCQCDVKPYKRHKDRIACIPQEDVEAFKRAHGLKHDGVARALLYIESFAPKATP
jgi:hypothetical protein